MSVTDSTLVPGAAAAEQPALLSVQGLQIQAGSGETAVTLVQGMSLHIDPGETLGLVGESGSGKTVTAMAVGGLLAPGLRIAGGRVDFAGHDLVSASREVLRSLRGSEIGFVFQDPQNCLDPVFSIGSQLIEAIRAHQHISKSAARARAVDLLDRVGIAQAAKRLSDYPHQFSGGMAQRVMIAIALCCSPKLLIADEPTTALDVTTQAQILDLLASIRAELGLSILLISHDLGVVAEMADRVAVMYAGQMVEQGITSDMFATPRHPYLDALIAAQPEEGAEAARLQTIPGRVPAPNRMPSGCRFHPRCAYAQDRCRTDEVDLVDFPSTAPHLVRCLRAHELTLGASGRTPAATAGAMSSLAAAPTPTVTPQRRGAETLLEVRGLTKEFIARSGFLGRGKHAVRAVDDVSFDIGAGQALGLVGETGAGKSTVGRLVLGLETPTSGTITFRGETLGDVDKRSQEVHRDLQVIFQNPYSSLNPTMTVVDLVAEPIDVHEHLKGTDRTDAVAALLASVGLGAEYMRRYIYEMSGGQLQRIAIARALAVNPELIVLDEPISSLDVSTQAQVVNLLEDLRASHGLSYLFIGHNLAVVSHLSDTLAILYRGRLVEIGESRTVYRTPRHPYTQALIGAILSTDPEQSRITNPTPVKGDGGVGPAAPDLGCVYAQTCPMAQDICRHETPPEVVCADGTRVHCHFTPRVG
jgi:peptide/nickel transport system ATP-binding protein